MSLISSSYFIGDISIPNTSYPETAAMVANLIATHERDYLIKALGYELYKEFWEEIATLTPSQRMVNLLLGADFRNGELKHWDGLISVTDQLVNLTVSLSGANDIFFTVGTTGAPVDGDDSYINLALAGLDIRVTQRGFGPLEILKDDSSNAATADIELLPTGGWKWRGATRFENADKYQVSLLSTTIDVSSYAPVAVPLSPIADYVFYKFKEEEATVTSSVGETSGQAENAMVVSPQEKMCRVWNRMAKSTTTLVEFLKANSAVYPEFWGHAYSEDIEVLTTRLNAFF